MQLFLLEFRGIGAVLQDFQSMLVGGARLDIVHEGGNRFHIIRGAELADPMLSLTMTQFVNKIINK